MCKSNIKEKILNSDIIYIGGGNTNHLMEVLKEKGFTIERLIQFGELEYQMKCGKTAIQETEDYQELEKIITYMYR